MLYTNVHDKNWCLGFFWRTQSKLFAYKIYALRSKCISTFIFKDKTKLSISLHLAQHKEYKYFFYLHFVWRIMFWEFIYLLFSRNILMLYFFCRNGIHLCSRPINNYWWALSFIIKQSINEKYKYCTKNFLFSYSLCHFLHKLRKNIFLLNVSQRHTELISEYWGNFDMTVNFIT